MMLELVNETGAHMTVIRELMKCKGCKPSCKEIALPGKAIQSIHLHPGHTANIKLT